MIGFMKYITTTSRCAVQYRGDRLEGSGLNGYQCGYIINICRKPGITQDQLAQELHVNRSNVTRQLMLLEENGFVDRKQSEADKRAIEVYPTKKAEEALPLVLDVLHDWSDYLTKDFSPEEFALLMDFLERIADKAVRYGDLLGKKDLTRK
jgi:DNA-binding MarR family transcriptional regulator